MRMLAMVNPRMGDGSGTASYQDGIHLNFATGQHYVKAVGAAPTVDAITTLFTFTGGNQSYYRASSGLLVASVTNTPRIEYGTTGDVLGLLMEAAGTNGLLQARDFSNASWVKTTMTAAKDQTGADGTANGASSLTATAGNGTALQTIVQAAVNSTLSFDIKRITGTGTIGICQDGVTFTDVTSQVNSSTYTRVTLTASQLNPILGIRLVTNGDKIAVDFGQFEAGAFASSRILTTTVSVARTADSCVRTLASEFSATAGTVVVAGRASGGQDAANPQGVWAFGVFPDVILFQRQTASDLGRFNAFTAGVGQIGIDGTFANSTAFKAATAYATNDAAISFNGGAIVSDAAVTLAGSYTGLYIGGISAFPMNGHIRTFDYYPSRLSDTYLQQASA